ncbi:hypothetical protein QUF76_19070 [Desulfobacterales bacterium HSG16]|nr:hypothetical protein [Desulfobacterales bacterium HSG16]
MEKKEDFYKKQISILSNIGLFYLIIIAMFAVPLLAAFVVVLIQGVIDFKYAIIAVGVVCGSILLFFLIKWIIAKIRKIRSDGQYMAGKAYDETGKGKAVEIGLFNGLLTFRYGQKDGSNQLLQLQQTNSNLKEIGHMTEHMIEQTGSAGNLVSRLKDLVELKNQNVLTEDEFENIRLKLIKEGQENDS